MGAVATNESAIFVGDHRPALDSDHAVGTANHQSGVSWHAGQSNTETLQHDDIRSPTWQNESKSLKPVSKNGSIVPTFRQRCRLNGKIEGGFGHRHQPPIDPHCKA